MWKKWENKKECGGNENFREDLMVYGTDRDTDGKDLAYVSTQKKQKYASIITVLDQENQCKRLSCMLYYNSAFNRSQLEMNEWH